MKKKVKNIIKIAFFLLTFNLLYSFEGNFSSFEDAYVEIRARKRNDDFFMVKYNYLNDKVYIGVKALFYFLEVYGVEVDLTTRTVSGEINYKKFEAIFTSDESFIVDDELYIGIDSLKKLNIKDPEYRPEELMVSIDPMFTLPYEEKEKSKIDRMKLDIDRLEDQDAEIDIEMKKQILSPGILKFSYYQGDLSKPENSYNMEYATQFLYGDLYLYQGLKPKNELETYKLTYRNIFDDKALTVGHFSLDTPSFIKINTKLKGFSLKEDTTYITKADKEGYVKISGEAIDADVIEIYQGNTLIDYQRVSKNDFEFFIRDRVSDGDYKLKIYYKNGKIEEREVYLIGDRKLLNKGKLDYVVQSGKSVESETDQIYGEVRYGFLDNLTLGLGIYELEEDDDYENLNYKLLKNNFLLKLGEGKYQSLINYTNYYDSEGKENTYNLGIRQRVGKNSFNFEHEKYSDKVSKKENYKNYYKISYDRSFYNNSVEVGYLQEETLDSTYNKTYYLNFDNRSFYEYAFGFGVSRKESDGLSTTRYTPEVSYSGVENINFLFSADFETEKFINNFDSTYRFRAYTRELKFFDTKLFYDTSFEASYSDSEKFLATLEFRVYFEEHINLETPIKITEDRVTVGVNVDKAFDLSDIRRDVKGEDIDKSWVYGKIFLDANSNEVYDDGEKLLENIGVLIDGETTFSGKHGKYFAEGIFPDVVHEVSINRRTMDPMLKDSKGKLKVLTRASTGLRIDIPVAPVSMVTGNIWLGDGITEKQFIRIISMTSIALEKDGKVYKEIDPEFDGLYFFEDVVPGDYTIRFKYLGDENISFSEKEMKVSVILEQEEEGGYFEGYDTIVSEIVEETEAEERIEGLIKDKKGENEIEEIIYDF